ncbi:cobaltochelatase subunit CobN [Sphingobium sp. 22B]|uniref:cobaltochelatase subunit CobN n=1 Tax=unclassified Sphingobium TaxID=2611147 RepID=UPI000783E20C|nr:MULTISPECIES: cobaltochelatase subunit CobN [unclassified Sphingobium]KXU33723.1 cobaltochelatase subunit CobN [Sphingobium sp. AM]KYC33668.1 cobaltochelatase subunit CobN [Sphingobium sp. 22B]OAP33409.1 cobaltochelatase subunit CobN [Sphingobium sp. 20006FA]
MHLLTATPGTVSNGDEAIDLGQSSGDIVLLTVADSELACFASAAHVLGQELGRAAPEIRLANLLQLKHPYSVDLYVEKVVAHAKFVCVILLGGKSYWPYGIDEIANIARKKGIAFAAIADGREDDPALRAASTVAAESCDLLRDYLRQGGIANAIAFLRNAARLAGFDAGVPDAPVPVADAGLYLPGVDRPTLDQVRSGWKAGQPTALFLFYRALLIAGTLEAVDRMVAGLETAGLNVLPVHVRALREPFARDFLQGLMAEAPPDVILNATAFAASAPGEPRTPSILEQADCAILQTIFASAEQSAWESSARGLGPRDLAMHVALPELDGRLFTRAVAFKAAARFDARTECSIVVPQILEDRVSFVSQLTANWAKLRRTRVEERQVALILANYPNRDGRIGNGVGLDTPASAAAILKALAEAGYGTDDAPTDGAALMQRMTGGITNAAPDRPGEITLSLQAYDAAFATLPQTVREAVRCRWGAPETDPFFRDGAFHLPVHRFGRIAVAVQPSRGYHVDPKSSYHDPALPPPHAYLAFHIWLAGDFGAHAVVHVGKHGNLEWLPGKAIALSENCFPEICAGPIPQIYPFIVNDPGEGTQAKRRIGACIVDHLTPPLTRAESYGPLKELEALVDEYYLAAGMDPRRLETLRKDILALAASQGLDKDSGAQGSGDEALAAIDNYLCELKEMQIRDGLHVFTQSPKGSLRRDLLISLARCPRGMDDAGQQSLLRALADDLGLDFDPLDCTMGAPWAGPRPEALQSLTGAPWRSTGDTVERLELHAIRLLDELEHRHSRAGGDDGSCRKGAPGPRSAAVLKAIETDLAPRVDGCGEAEKAALLKALNGDFVAPGPSGAPTRGRPDVLPTGRNFYSVDTRAVPTVAAWNLGQRSADLIVQDYLQREGDYPRAIALSAWGTANMRTGGDDIAQALALMGVRPRWDWASGRVIGFEVMKIAELNRPRVDVTFRVSGFFRDAFPEQIDLIDSAARAVMALDEPDEDNPAAARHRIETAALIAQGTPEKAARRRAGSRVFGSKPGAYGAGLQAMIDEKIWHDRSDLANVYLDWGSYAYGGGVEGDSERGLFAQRLTEADALIQNQDNREHDLLDSDDYYQFEGGIAAAVEHLSGRRPLSYHNDHSRPERPVIRTLEDEIGRIVRARVTNPKWIAGMMRHGYKGAFEIAASVDYLFAFAATTHAVKDHHFDAVHAAFIEDEAVRAFMAEANPAALRETAARLHEALDRALWKPRSNSAAMLLSQLKDAPQ